MEWIPRVSRRRRRSINYPPRLLLLMTMNKTDDRVHVDLIGISSRSPNHHLQEDSLLWLIYENEFYGNSPALNVDD